MVYVWKVLMVSYALKCAWILARRGGHVWAFQGAQMLFLFAFLKRLPPVDLAHRRRTAWDPPSALKVFPRLDRLRRVLAFFVARGLTPSARRDSVVATTRRCQAAMKYGRVHPQIWAVVARK